MKISQVKIKNFRGYKDETKIDINDLTVFVGKNDVGKSTILEALDIFFNREIKDAGIVQLEKGDINKQSELNGNNDIVISVIFDEFPDKVIIDSQNKTTIKKEYLLNSDGKLEIIKIFSNAGKEKVFINAHHPTNPDCEELLLKKQKDLQEIIKKKNISCNRTKNSEMRKAIWKKYQNNLMLKEIKIDITKEDAKNIWERLKAYMPLYALFQSDRKNSDGDGEIQDPMKIAVGEILEDKYIRDALKDVSIRVTRHLQRVAEGTREKLAEMNPDIAKKLNADIPSYEDLKWESIFKSVTILSDEDIPINKRGSGVKRLILLNFFRAEAERRRKDKNVPDIIYAMEEPETSQHLDHQRKIIDAFKKLSQVQHTQIILTTHSPAIVRMLKFENLRLVEDKQKNKKAGKIMQDSLTSRFINEVNFLAFGEGDENYHNELYGFIESKQLLTEFKREKDTRDYNNERTGRLEQKILSEYIRHQIHHPENELNPPYTHEELQQSIMEMRDFITGNNAT